MTQLGINLIQKVKRPEGPWVYSILGLNVVYLDTVIVIYMYMYMFAPPFFWHCAFDFSCIYM